MVTIIYIIDIHYIIIIITSNYAILFILLFLLCARLRRLRKLRKLRKTMSVFRVFRFLLNRLFEPDARLVGHVEKGADAGASVRFLQAVGILAVTFSLVVVGIHAAQLVEEFPAVLAEFVGKGEGDAEPVVIAGSEVDARADRFLHQKLQVVPRGVALGPGC